MRRAYRGRFGRDRQLSCLQRAGHVPGRHLAAGGVMGLHPLMSVGVPVVSTFIVLRVFHLMISARDGPRRRRGTGLSACSTPLQEVGRSLLL